MHGRAVVTCNLSFFEINSTLTIDWKKIEYGVRSRCNAGNTHRLHTAHHAALDKSHMTHTTIGGGARKVAIIAADLHTLTHVVPVHRTPNSSPVVVVDLRLYKAVKMENERGEIVDLYVFPRWLEGVVWCGVVFGILKKSAFMREAAIDHGREKIQHSTTPAALFPWPARKKKSKKKKRERKRN